MGRNEEKGNGEREVNKRCVKREKERERERKREREREP